MRVSKSRLKFHSVLIRVLGIVLLVTGALLLLDVIMSWSEYGMQFGQFVISLLLVPSAVELFFLRDSGRQRIIFVMVFVLLKLWIGYVIASYLGTLVPYIRLFGYEYQVDGPVKSLAIPVVLSIIPLAIILYLASRKSKAITKRNINFDT